MLLFEINFLNLKLTFSVNYVVKNNQERKFKLLMKKFWISVVAHDNFLQNQDRIFMAHTLHVEICIWITVYNACLVVVIFVQFLLVE